MSTAAPANRKNLPAHTPVTTGFRCEYCDGLFGKRYLLKTHQQKLHGLPKTVAAEDQGSSSSPSRSRLPRPSITTLVLPAIETAAMTVAKSRGEIPFAVMHVANEIPLIVRILDQGNVSVLKAAEASDFRESQRGCPVGTSVTIAVVASIFQKFADDGQMYFEIRQPVSGYQPTMPEGGESGEEVAPVAAAPEKEQDVLCDPAVPLEGVLQESLDGGDMYKTLTQINSVFVRETKPKATQRTPAPAKSSSSSALKRKNPSSRNGPGGAGVTKQPTSNRQSRQPMTTSTPKKPKVITLVDDLSNWNRNQNVSPNKPIGAGPLLSPIRQRRVPSPPVQEEVIELQDPLVDLDLQDLIQVDDDGLLPGVMDDLGEAGGFL